jgi:hypothetical protein
MHSVTRTTVGSHSLPLTHLFTDSRSVFVARHLFGMHSLAKMRVHRLPHYEMPAIFTDPAYPRFCTSVLSTSNCGGNALDLFGFGPVTANGLGLGCEQRDTGATHL